MTVRTPVVVGDHGSQVPLDPADSIAAGVAGPQGNPGIQGIPGPTGPIDPTLTGQIDLANMTLEQLTMAFRLLCLWMLGQGFELPLSLSELADASDGDEVITW